MPLPIPKKEEKKSEFIARCMSDQVMVGEFPNVAQRVAVCQKQFEDPSVKSEPKNDEKVRRNPDCPDGWEHQMPDGSYMCGKKHKTTKKKSPYGNESFDDYPKAATENAKRVLKWVDENGWGDCLEATGKQRCHQIANREPLSRDTIARIASFKRHQQHKDVPFDEGCGGLAWNAWGGTEMIEWSIRKLEQIDNN
tara:strand:+ start:1221 stop:1805 length:585 start_codon:yes stop_codon:yes gene_type:complete